MFTRKSILSAVLLSSLKLSTFLQYMSIFIPKVSIQSSDINKPLEIGHQQCDINVYWDL